MKIIDRLVTSEASQLVGLDAQAFSWAVAFMGRYETLGAQLADAALMFIMERVRINTVFILDRRDFSVYRTTSGQALTIVPDA